MNNLSSTFTIDDLREIAYRGSYRDSERALARELLALRRAQREPIAFIAECGAIIGEGSPFFDDYKNPQPLYAAPQLPAVPEYPELLPCPVLLEPGFRFGKGVPTSSMLGALKRRAEHQAELDAMSPEARAEYDASIEKLKSVLMPDGAEQRLAAAVELIKQAAPHMLADESLKDPGGALCGKARSVPDGWVMVPREMTDEIGEAIALEAKCCGGIALDIYNAAIAAAPKPEVKS